MDSDETPIKSDQNLLDKAKLEALMTPENVLIDAVARKRRKFTKKRSTSLPKREATPVRNMDDKTTTTSDEEIEKKKPKTPERRRRRFSSRLAKQKPQSETESEPGISMIDPNYKEVRKSNSIPKQDLDDNKRNSISNIAQAEIMALYNRTKKSLTAVAHKGRERFRKDKELVKRSQSAPHQITEQELIESFRRAQLLSAERAKVRKYSDTSLRSVTPEVTVPKPFRPEVQEFVKQRKKEKMETSTKIIEILDPKTSVVLERKAVIKPTIKELFSVMRMFSICEIYRQYKLFKIETQEEYRRIRTLWNSCMCKLFLIMVMCGIGGIIFKTTEGTFEHFYKCGVKRVKRDFIDLLWIKSHNLREEDWKSLARTRLRIFEEELHAAHEAGMTSYSGQRSWSFLNGIVYSLTVVTTIGYGHIYPTTTTGRALTIVYSIIGIPLFLIALTDFGKLFTRGIKYVWSFVRRLYYTGSCRRARKTAHVQEIFKGAQMMYEIATFRRPSMYVDKNYPGGSPEEEPPTPAISNFEIDDEFNLPISIAILILILYIFLGALFYYIMEGWDFFASFYFVFISMSTIGFGDYVPKHPVCMIVSIVYLVFGLALMSMCINVVQLKLSDTFKQASAKLGATIGIVVEDDGSIATSAPTVIEIPEVHEVPNNIEKEKKNTELDLKTD